MKKFKISIITVTKNSEKFIKKNIQSVLSQNYKNFEHIIVDGNSSDKTLEIAKSFKNKIRIIINRNDKGLYHAMNVGIKRSPTTKNQTSSTTFQFALEFSMEFQERQKWSKTCSAGQKQSRR